MMKAWSLRPADDIGAPLQQQYQGLRRELGTLGALTHMLWCGFLRLWLHTAHDFKVEGREHIPALAPFVVVANHGSHYDTLALSAALPVSRSDRVYALAAGDTFFSSIWSSAFAACVLNALPIWRSKTQRTHLKTLRERLLAEQCGFILFPEGTRCRDGRIGRFKPGVGALVAGTETLVVPCHIKGAYEALPPGKAMPRLSPVGVRFGTPLTFSDTENTVEGWRCISHASEAAVRALGCIDKNG